MGSQTYWFGMPEERYLSWEDIVYYRHYVPGSTLEDALKDLRPDILVIDTHMSQFITDTPAQLSDYARHLWIPRRELQAFLDRQASLVDAFASDTSGNVRVYQIAWR